MVEEGRDEGPEEIKGAATTYRRRGRRVRHGRHRVSEVDSFGRGDREGMEGLMGKVPGLGEGY